MARGGFRPGAGRPKGTGKTSKPVTKAEKVLSAAAPDVPATIESKRFKTALEFAMATINDAGADMADKVRLAIAAMPFQHPKLADVGQGKKEQAAEAAKAAGSGRFAAPAPPKLAVDNTKK